jgi:hypothetical protein
VQDEAALAIGASRLPGSVPLLQSAWEQTSDTRFRAVLLRAISASREDNAIAFLLNLVRRARQNDAEDALEALALHRDSVEVRRMVSEAVGASESALRDPFTRLFDR